MLRTNGVTVLVDVRSFPSSRTFPQWDQAALEAELPDDIDYHWLQNLGGRRHTPAGVESPNGGWRVKAFAAYADHMATEEFRSGLADLLRIGDVSVPAIMCSEAVPWRCHRRLIKDALVVAGAQVYDIMSLSTTRRAELTPFARVTDGKIVYPEPAEG